MFHFTRLRRALAPVLVAALLAVGLTVLAAGPSAAATVTETTGVATNTWTNYTNAGGTQGPTIPAFTSVQISCRLTGFRVANGNTWWYLIASSPWNSAFYASADPFYNNGATSGGLQGTPFVDTNVPICGSGSGVSETAGGEANTWTNYTNAGGTQGPTIGGSTTVTITCRLNGFRVANGNTWWYQIASSPWNNNFYVSADAFYNNGATSGSLRGTPFYDPAVPICGGGGGGTGGNPGTNETAGGVTNTWTNYSNAGGTQGPSIPSGTTVAIACKLTGFRVANGNTWWYLIAASPWNSQFYASADAFYNNGATSGSLLGTPYVDPAVPDCAAGARPGSETTGTLARTWTNYTNAGGREGPTIATGQTVQITCRTTGFAVANKNSWWYLIGSAPWNNVYYVSADPFYNNGSTSGPLAGTPFYDPAVPVCVNAPIAPTQSTAYGMSSASTNRTGCVSGSYPINCASGDFWHTFTDVSVQGRGPGLSMTRTYNNQGASASGLFGHGWTSTFEQHLTQNQDGSATIALPDGSRIVAASAGNGAFTVPNWAGASLTLAAGTYTYRQKATADRPTTIYTFDSTGALTRIADLNGDAVALHYTGDQLTSVTDDAGRAVTLTAGANGRVGSITDPAGAVTRYAYDSAARLTSVTDPGGHVTSFTYDQAGQMLTMTDPNGAVVTNTYDAAGRVLTQTDGAGRITRYAYTGDNFSSLGGTTTVTDSHGVVEVQQYANGFLARLTKAFGTPSAATWVYAYDASTFGMTSMTDPNGKTSTRTYNSAGQILTSTDNAGATTTTTYNPLGQPLTVTDPLGGVTANTYDAGGNLLSSTDPNGARTVYAHADADNPGDVTAVSDPDGRTTTTTYDASGVIASSTSTPAAGTSLVTRYAHDRLGRPTCTAPPVATAAGRTCAAPGAARVVGTTGTAYNANGHPTAVTDAAGRVTTNVYDADENLVKVTDAAGRVTTHTYDGAQRLLTTTTGATSASPITVRNNYDLAPGVHGCPASADVVSCTQVTNGKGESTTDAYDALGRRIATIRPDGTTTKSTYDPVGNRLTTTTPDQHTTTYGYDSVYRPTSVRFDDGATHDTALTYDGNGRRATMTDASGTTTYTYDRGGRVTSVVNGAGATVRYGYDGAGHVTTLTYPNAQSVTRTYDGASRLTSVTDWLSHTTNFSYDANSNLTTTGYANGDQAGNTYDQADHLTRTTLSRGVTTLAVIGYQRNGVGQITRESDSGALTGVTTYAYDASGRLTSAGSATYGYDQAGNPTGYAASTQEFAAGGRVVTATEGPVNTTFTFDQMGRRTRAAAADGTTLGYSYDQADNLTGITATGPAPTVTALSSVAGPLNGGGTVTVTGTDFGAAPHVSFGTRAAANVVVTSPTTLTATVPAGTRTVDVSVTTMVGRSAATPAAAYTYQAVPIITAVSPSAGPLAGGAAVVLTGRGFTRASAVRFGSTAATGVTVTSDTTISAIAPPGSSGAVDITVTTPGGTSQATAADRFTYTDGPIVAAVSPAAGPLGGGTTVTITGSTLTGVTGVLFGTQAATSVAVVSPTSVTAVSPAGTLGSVDVTVTAATGTSPTSSADRFTYTSGPTITKVSPAIGPLAGGGTVTITGTGLSGATAVTFGGQPATSVSLVSATSLKAVAPAQSAGTVDVRVTAHGGTSPTSVADTYTYAPVPVVTSVSPTAGPLTAGTVVTVTGAGFIGVTSVTFGGTVATGLTVISPTSLRVTAPAGTGTVHVKVSAPGGTSTAVAGDRFSYQPVPTVTKLTPGSGSAGGGTSVKITGTNFSRASAVRFGAQSATFTVSTAVSITATAPAGSGTVDVTVTTPGGTSATTNVGQFTYTAVAARAGVVSRAKAAPTRAFINAAVDTSVDSAVSTAPVVAYAYNGDGLRTSRTTAAGTTQFTYDTLAPTPALLTDGATNYIYGPDNTPIEQIGSDGTTAYYFHDAIGSTRALTSQAGAVVGTATYGAYGRLARRTGTATTPIGYAGGYTDAETGMLYLIHRYYDPQTAQFLTEDPAVDVTRAPYSYVENDPLNRVDPDGNFPVLAAVKAFGWGFNAGKTLGNYVVAGYVCSSAGWASRDCSNEFEKSRDATIWFAINTIALGKGKTVFDLGVKVVDKVKSYTGYAATAADLYYDYTSKSNGNSAQGSGSGRASPQVGNPANGSSGPCRT